jgi:nucleoid-associated protein YgaU
VSISKARLASELLGLGPGGGELERLTITYERGRGRQPGSLEALFNPNEVSFSRSLQWEQQRRARQGGEASPEAHARFRYVDAETFSIELLFDTYESRAPTSWRSAVATALIPTNPFQRRDATDVRKHTQQVANLAEVNVHLHRPPICQLLWGRFDLFTGVLTSLAQRFTLFLEDGTPVRATVSCTFVESVPRTRELYSADVTKTRQVRRNDTLQSLAAEEYNDPRLWRHIATANGIVNPRDLRPGAVLTIPRLQP